MIPKMIEWLSVRDNITFLIALAGFGLSLWNFFSDLWRNRCSISVEYISHYCGVHPNGKTVLQLRLNIVNRSSAPISISRMFLIYQGCEFEFLFPSVCVWEFAKLKNHEVVKQEEIKSQALPFKIEGRGAVGGYFLVYVPPEAKDVFAKKSDIWLLMQTSRRKKRFSLAAHNPGRDAEQYGKKS